MTAIERSGGENAMSVQRATRATGLQEEDQPDVAAVVAFAASEEVGYVAGASISVNGGMHIM